ncbi:hypothetical protein P8A22_10305 [Streptomyces laculatispora]|uniref:Uncharacterized protein n=1 Tax=Streptomyces laculatispora TaxID=887464 RepID=A0ABY9I0H9_9ACTN|nr:hypothetical protein [Streptomyces laculatispora]WLQ40355.1 hypothetical protein P8A22_10305 [Streptomyces laculatispora]
MKTHRADYRFVIDPGNWNLLYPGGPSLKGTSDLSRVDCSSNRNPVRD